MQFKKRSGILIPTSLQYDSAYIQIKEALARRVKSYNTSNYTFYIFYIESEKFLLIPRNFPIKTYFWNVIIDDKSHEGQPIKIKHNITPRSESQKNAIKYMMDNESGILQLDPGVGKTVITIYMIAKRKVKSLILVHRDSLADQWRDRLLQFTNLKDDNIARLTSATFEQDFEKSIIISTAQTFLSLLKRKRKEFLMALDKANVGVFVADEVHTSVGAPTFAECSIHMPSKYTYGLSATPYRHDGNEDIIQFHLGTIFEDDDTTGTMKAKVTVILLDYEIDTPFRYTYIHWGGDFQRARYLNMFRKSNTLKRVVRGLLTTFNGQRDLICMVERINYINELYDWLPSNNKSKFCGNEKLDALKAKTTFATPGKCRDGIDAPWKDCVIMTSPISNIKQLTGRIVREVENKKTPSVIDLVDYGCTYMSRTFYNRNTFYKERGWEIQYVLFKDDKLSQIDEGVAIDIIEGR
jgi:superfamily II DNA or RNA helicase